VHAVTDVTGFGLLGHALEICRGAGLSAEISAEPPLLAGVEQLARAGVRTGASTRNWASYGQDVSLPDSLPEWRRDLLTDPQTSGGLLIAVEAGEADAVLALVRGRGFGHAAVVGRLSAGPAQIRVV
jgi:selenide,water dikinase